MSAEAIILNAAITVFAFGLLLISFASYRKHKTSRLLALSCVFVILLIKGILLSISLFLPALHSIRAVLFSDYGGFFDLLVLIFLFIVSLKR